MENCLIASVSLQMHARADVEKSADVMLASGMETKNQNQMALALQVSKKTLICLLLFL